MFFEQPDHAPPAEHDAHPFRTMTKEVQGHRAQAASPAVMKVCL
jgi:hypothetical protein